MSGRRLSVFIASLYFSVFAAFSFAIALSSSAVAASRELPLPLPSTVKPEDSAVYQTKLLDWLKAGSYVQLKWAVDKGIRDTGPWINDVYYGTHKAARIYYSPEVIDWLCAGRPEEIPDGAIIIKEMHSIEPCLDVTLDSDGCMTIQADPPPDEWTVMIKAKQGSHDRALPARVQVSLDLVDQEDHLADQRQVA